VYLATTALESFWDKSQKILFLGEWCKLYSRKAEWEKLDHEVLPYHWDDRRKLEKDFRYLQGVYEKELVLLSDRLNALHGIDHSIRYWRIVIGQWLRYFIEMLYDRYLSIERAANSGLVTNTWISDGPEHALVPNDFGSFLNAFLDDPSNHLLYSYLIRRRGIPFEVAEPDRFQAREQTGVSAPKSRNHLLRRLLAAYPAYLPPRFTRFAFVASYFSRKDLVKLQLSLKQAPAPLQPLVELPLYPVDSEARRFLFVSPSGEDDFESLVNALIPLQMPRAYVEGYQETHRRSITAFPGRPTVIHTANAFSSDEAFKFWAAHQVEMGAKLVISQHGGHHGTGLWSSEEKHEVDISDRYFTWGWDDEREPKIVPLASGHLNGFAHARRQKPDGVILWVFMSLPRYAYWLYSVPAGPQMLLYLHDQLRFSRAVSKNVHDLLVLRLFPKDFGWNEYERWRDWDPALKIYRGRVSLAEQLKESRLVVCTYNATTYLETFTADVPTIIFWNPLHWELRSAALPYFQDLYEAGILHYTPEAAAEKADKIYEDPLSWWREPLVQKAKQRFAARFARTSGEWKREWKEKLLPLAQGN
jgi:putative transferase (TIGR04331 family)